MVNTNGWDGNNIKRKTYTFVNGPKDDTWDETWGSPEIKYFDIKGEKLRQIGVYRRKFWSKTYYWEGWIYL